MTRWTPDRLADDVAAVGRRGLARDDYFAEVGARLRRVVDCDALCWHTVDPMTRLLTGDVSADLVEAGVFTAETVYAAGEAVVSGEYRGDDVNTFAGLAAKRVPVGILSEVTRGLPERSGRYRGVLAPAGIPFELRAAFVTRGRCWGAVHVARREGAGDFGREDAVAVAAITAAVAEGIRTSLRFDAARRPEDRGAPGMIVLDAANQVELITAPARELLAALRYATGPAADDTPPSAVLALAGFARSRTDGTAADGVAVPGASGWITLHASLPEGAGSGRVAIVIERAASPQTTALRLEAHGVTAREREIATLLAQGLSNAAIAEQLVLSPYTVQDHIRSLFEKTGVGSRQELVARVFLDEYLPQLVRGAPVDARGAFVA